MNKFLIFCLVCIVIYCSITWVLPRLFAFLFKRKYHITVRVGRIALPLSLRDVVISKDGFSVHIEEVSIRSSFFNSEVTKLLSIIVRDVRINKDIGTPTSPNNSQKPPSLVRRISRSNSWHNESQGERSCGPEDFTKFAQRKVLDFRDKKVPPSIITFAQFMAVHVYSVSVVLLRAHTPGWLLHATAGEIHLDGSIVNSARTLLVNVTVAEAQAKILRHTPRGTVDTQPCLGELSFGIGLEAMLIAQGPLSLEKLQVTMNHTKAIVYEGLYSFIRENKTTRTVYDTERLYDPTQSTEISKDMLIGIAPIIPKNLSLKIEHTTLTGMRENSRTEFSSTLQCLKLNTRFSSNLLSSEGNETDEILAQLCLGVEDLQVHSLQEKIIVLKKFSLDSKMEEDNTINVTVKLHTLNIFYNHKDIHSWLSTNFLQTKTSNSLKLNAPNLNDSNTKDYGTSYLRRTNSYQTNESTNINQEFAQKFTNKINSKRRKYKWFETLLENCVFNCSIIELWNVSGEIKMNEQNATMGFNHIKVILDQLTETRESEFSSTLPRLFLGKRHWSTEFLVESLWTRVISGTHDPVLIKKYHMWGTPLYLGMALVKVCSHGASGCKMEAMFDTIRSEWSSELNNVLVQGARCIQQYKSTQNTTSQQTVKTKPQLPQTQSKLELLINVSLSNVNIFLITENKMCIMTRLESLSIDRNFENTINLLNGLKMTTFLQNPVKHFTCLHTDDIQTAFGYVKQARIEFNITSKTIDFSIQLLESIQLKWSANLHLKFMTLYENFKNLKQDIHAIRSKPIHKEAENVQDKTAVNKVKNIIMQVKGDIGLEIYISEKHNMAISADELSLSTSESGLRLLGGCIIINIDGSDVFTIQGIHMQRLVDNLKVRQERKHSDGFILPWNNTWAVTIPSLRVCFPYDHQYAQAIQNEFISLFKWLKIVHGRQKKPFTQDSPLPSDLVITVKEFLFEMSDDPFEIKLRDNYELLEDEYKESLKRQKMLDAKVAELCKTHLLLPAGKVEELYASLSKKNAEIYVQRSRQINQSGPSRTRLFAWCLNDLEILALADPSIHGTENCCRVMRAIDPESPWPEEGLEFTTLWCRSVMVNCVDWKFLLRDFPQPMLDMRNLSLFGLLVGAEQEAPRRAKRDVVIELGAPWGQHTVQRGMTSLKFYHDFNCEIDHWSYAFGPCWEPVMAQCNLSFEKISAPSRDPSPTLPFWDKMRLLLHGRLTMWVRQMTVLLHASLDPYNTTEEMELTWTDVAMDWTNAKIVFKGNLNVYVRTASKYDDCQLMQLPNLKLTIKIHWICLANPNDHHSVIPCAPDKLPEYSINQEHDSFRAFRSQNVNVNISYETKPAVGTPNTDANCPMLVLFGSTLRWFESLKLILSGVTRPTRRGRVFNNVRPRKAQLSRHYKKVHLLLGLHRFQVCYWMSCAKQRGFQLHGGRISSSSEHTLALHPVYDGLRHRPRAEWSTMYMNCELNDTEIWLKSALQEDNKIYRESINLTPPVEKCFCLSVDKVSYGREAALPPGSSEKRDVNPTHRLVVYDLKGAWTKSNRDVAFALFDTFMKNKQLKKNLSTEALKGFRGDNSTTPLKSRRNNETPPTPPANAPIQTAQAAASSQGTPSPMSKLQSGHASAMLQQLIAEAENKNVVFSDDLSTETKEQHLQGVKSCQDMDVVHNNWLIALVNSQVLLKGCETQGYIILSAAKAEIWQRVHRPVWRDRSLVPKTTWVGTLECMQYYATVSAGENDSLYENIMWLTVDNIQEKDSTVIADLPDVPDLVGSGQSVGGVVSETVGASTAGVGEHPPIQLQRIVSRCKCEFFYVSYGDTSIDPSTLQEVPPIPQEETTGPWEKKEQAVDAFTLMHHDLDVCTNSLQYAMILDVLNNLLLYVEPQRKQALERLARMRFQLQLHRVEDQRRPIQHLQNQVRSLVSKLRRLEKEMHLVQRALHEDPENEHQMEEMNHLEIQVYECKEQLMVQSEELDMMLSCYKETQLSATQKMATMKGDKPVSTVRANEICFKHAQWRLTETDGQLGIADLVLSNFLYTKNSKSNDSVEHLLELGYVRMTNLLPNQIYSEVLCPTELQTNMPVDRKRVLRVFCRERPPVGGISVKEHFEINVVPITIELTKKFYNTMLKFCFPERDPDQIDADVVEEVDEGSSSKSSASSTTSSVSKKSKSKKSAKDTNFYIKIEQKDDVEKMKERAEKNKLFIYIKIPEVPVRVSYKGNKEKNIEDIKDFSLVIPTLEYHNVTWTWLDLLMAMKNDSRRVIVSQAIKQKLTLHRNRGSTDEGASPQEEDKAKMLFGARHVSGDSKSLKKGVTGVFKFSK